MAAAPDSDRGCAPSARAMVAVAAPDRDSGCELRQKPSAQIEQRPNGKWLANHRHGGPVIPDGRALGFFSHDVHVLGPERLSKETAFDDMRQFKAAYQRDGPAGLFEALRRVRSCDEQTRLVCVRECSVQVEMNTVGSRRARAVCMFSDGDAEVPRFGQWKRSRLSAEEDVKLIVDAFVDGAAIATSPLSAAAAAPAAGLGFHQTLNFYQPQLHISTSTRPQPQASTSHQPHQRDLNQNLDLTCVAVKFYTFPSRGKT